MSETLVKYNPNVGGGAGGTYSKSELSQLNATLGDQVSPGSGPVPQAISMLSYPLDVQDNPQAGHYINFTAKKRKPGKIGTGAAKKDFAKIIANMEQEQQSNQLDLADAEAGGNYTSEFSQKDINFKNQIDGANANKVAEMKALKSGTDGKNKSILQQSLGTTETVAVISLYMPPNVTVNYKVNYGDQEIGNLALIGKEAFEGFKSAASQSLKDRLKAAGVQTKSAAKEALLAFANTSLDTFAPGARTLSNIARGSVVTPRMELMFEGITRRSFSYSFVFIPKSERESKIVEEIVYEFKVNMMPEYSNNSTRREMDIPNTFEIDYQYKGSRNSFLNRINTCFLQDVNVQYGADRFTAYESTKSKFGVGPPAQKTTVTLQFTELELLNKDLIKDGY